MKKVAVVFAGCGFLDGAEIHESVCTLLALDRAGAKVQCFAPDVPQMHVVNHVTGQVSPNETRNVLAESARIARGQIKALHEAKARDFDAVILPGGFGSAKNLCDFAVKGPDCQVNPEVERFLREFHDAGKPIGLICISPAIGAKLFGQEGVELTIGDDAGTASALEKLGAKHVKRAVTDIHVDGVRKVVTTPAYMYHARISEVSQGIEKLVAAVLEMA